MRYWNNGAAQGCVIKLGIAACQIEMYCRGALASYGARQASQTSIRPMLVNVWTPAEQVKRGDHFSYVIIR
jgi:hypothetical protein